MVDSAKTWKPAFRQALIGAFDQPAMAMLVSDYFPPDTLDNLSPPGFGKTFETRLYEVIQQAEMNGWLFDLVAAAHERRPTSAPITAVAERVGLTAIGVRLDNPSGVSLEALVQKNAKSINPVLLRERLAALEGQVCFVDIPINRGGTGFLVGPDLVITNQHVIKPLIDGDVRWQDVMVRFDYKRAIDGTELDRRKQTEVGLVGAGWCVDSRPPSKLDGHPELGDAGPDETDCAIIRLADPIGDQPVGGDTPDPKATPRGFIRVDLTPPAVAAGNQVFLLQHPLGEPLQLAIGAVQAFNGAGTRMRHDANSQRGSSGSPVFDADLQLVALHHARDAAEPPTWNEAVPFNSIQKAWAKFQVVVA